jgi:AcrR family transcriptional regulator
MTEAAVPRTPSRRERQRLDTRQRVFEAAVAEFRRVGFAEAQIDRIARAAGVVRGTFYFHFPRKEDVLLALEDLLEGQVAAGLIALPDADPSLRAILTTVAEGVLEAEARVGDERLMRDILSIYVRRRPEPPSAADPFPLVVELERRLAEVEARGELRPGLRPDQLTVTFLASVFGVLLTRAESPRERSEGLEALVDVFVQGVAFNPRAH